LLPAWLALSSFTPRWHRVRDRWFIWLIWFIWSIWFVLLVDPEKPNKLDKPNKPNNDLLMPADFFSILLVKGI
jgi:hypothetical protein